MWQVGIKHIIHIQKGGIRFGFEEPISVCLVGGMLDQKK